MANMNLNNYKSVAAALAKLETQLAGEAKIDTRLVRGHNRVKRLILGLSVAQSKYEIIHSRKVPAKVEARKAKAKAAKKAPAKKAAAKKSNVVDIKTAKVA